MEDRNTARSESVITEEEFDVAIAEDGREKDLLLAMMRGEITAQEFHEQEERLIGEVIEKMMELKCARCRWKAMQGGFPWASTN